MRLNELDQDIKFLVNENNTDIYKSNEANELFEQIKRNIEKSIKTSNT